MAKLVKDEASAGSRPGYLFNRREQNPSEAESHSHSSPILRSGLSAKGDKKNGLSEKEVSANREKFGNNVIHKKELNILDLFLRQIFGSPLTLLLLTATVVSYFFGERTSALYISFMILLSVVLGFINEYSAEKTVANLLKKISNLALVIRDGRKQEIPVNELVVGDLVCLTSGNTVPADLSIIESENLELNEAVLTGESMPVSKTENQEALMGTVVLAGSGLGKVEKVGKATQFGKIATDISFVKPETDFQLGLKKFSQMLIKVITVLCLTIFIFNVLLGKAPLTALMFALAIAVGLTPELLSVIVTVSLSHGAGKLAKKNVISKQLVAIENLGNMDILCTDKTGTLTEGDIRLVKTITPEQIVSPQNQRSFLDTIQLDNQLLYYGALCNSALVSGNTAKGNPIDVAIWKSVFGNKEVLHRLSFVNKIYEKPFNYEKKAELIATNEELIVKGTADDVFAMCEDNAFTNFQQAFVSLSQAGYRVLALAKKDLKNDQATLDLIKNKQLTWEAIKNLKFFGFLLFMDTPKSGSKEALRQLRELNVAVKILTGDNEIITKKICDDLDLPEKDFLLGPDLEKMSDQELIPLLKKIEIFARVSPEQKLRVIKLLRNTGHAVGYLGDGVNDLPALHEADVAISVNSAVDVAKDAANIVLLKKSLSVIADGIIEGRKTFSNTIKYILMGTSSNFGNMFSAAIGSFFLPFLPMTPTQILLNNGLYDLAQITIPSDNVDPESIIKPKHWDVKFIRDYMVFFGPISSVYDLLTYFLMLKIFQAGASLFQAGWFIESLATQVLVVFVIRTSMRPFWKSRPGKWLMITTFLVVVTGVLLPYSFLGKSIGFSAPPLTYFLFLITFVVTYLLLVEFLKGIFLKKYKL